MTILAIQFNRLLATLALIAVEVAVLERIYS